MKRAARPPEPASGSRRAFLRQAGLAAVAPWVLGAAAGRSFASAFLAAIPGTTVIDVRSKGARGDGRQDDTAAIQAAIDALPAEGGTVTVPPGIYLVDAARSIVLRSGTRLRMAPQAQLQAMPNGLERSCVLKVLQVSNVEIVGGRIVGERDQHRGDTGEWGHGICIRAAHQVSVRDIQVTDCWGDGVFIGATGRRGSAVESTDIELRRVVCDRNRRQGLSITPCRRVGVIDCIFRNTEGTRPQSGIDIEPQTQGMAQDIRIEGCTLSGNQGCGLELHDNVVGLVVVACTITGNRGYGVLGVGPGQVTLERNTITGNGLDGIAMTARAYDVQITANLVQRNSARFFTRRRPLALPADAGGVSRDLRVDPSTRNVRISGNTFSS
ncbi:right-handed parallel beta-helix repeat-containing protein [Frateuria defendens]|uniref:right-handed parallel beta-helix repeat-containing protein n=1 Tax=Frateuria defendens TaxID=2219559 RepID=UPI00066FC6C3|nr:right-handed parallel beta-helix repeat-containing protein [Frateuria defendens]